ncbi:MAG TPA: DUF1588 domain-containing protein [Polyangiaceae bacterium]|nr:DUF1588 domain-containing protein [Polyangiaceae bacterium]
MRLSSWGISGFAALALGALACGINPAPAALQSVGGSGAMDPGPTSCEDTNPAPAPLRLLTRFQYDNAVRDLLGDDSKPAAAFPPETEADGYGNNANANRVNPLLVENYLSAAEAVSARAIQNLDTVAPCAEADQLACGRAFVTDFAGRAFRRPLTDAELAPLFELFEKALAVSYAKGVELVVQTVLQSPQFLYRVEALRAPTSELGAIALGPSELAGRLAFTLWGSVPDGALLSAATEGRLRTAGDVEREARRLLEDGRARALVRDFSEQWLELRRLEGAVRDGAEVEPATLSGAWRESLGLFLEHAYFGESGTFEQLFTSPDVWVNSTHGPLYGAPEASSAFAPLALPDPRAGLLTQPALLAVLSHADQTAPVIRGVFVRERILCEEVPDPPPDVNVIPPDPDPNATTRERFRQHTEQETCASCHRLIDGIGFGFERYDQLGNYRDMENGLEVDESGEVVGIGEAGLDGPFAGAVELSQKIAQSPRARACLATHWYRYTFGRREQAEDTCSLGQVQERFASSNGDLKELLVALTQTDAFLYRPAIPEEAP